MRVSKRTVAGVACSLCCALCVGLYLVQANDQVDQARAEALARYGGEQVEICVATRHLAAGEVVGSGDVTTKLWVADLLPEGAVTDSADIVGRRLGSDIYKGEVICARRAEVATSELSVPQGMAALSVPARLVQTVGGSVEAGMLVDVYATGSTSTVRLVRKALVLATSAGSEDAAASRGQEWVTLAVDPGQVQELVAAAQNLELYFVIPSEDEEEAVAAEAGSPADEAVPASENAEPQTGAVSPPETEEAAKAAEGSEAQ